MESSWRSWRSFSAFQGVATEVPGEENRCSTLGYLRGVALGEKGVLFCGWEVVGTMVWNTINTVKFTKRRKFRKNLLFFWERRKPNCGKEMAACIIRVPSLQNTYMHRHSWRALCFLAWPFFTSRAFFHVTFDEPQKRRTRIEMDCLYST